MNTSKIFINIFIEDQSDYVKQVNTKLSDISSLLELESFIGSIAFEYETDEYGTTTWVNDHVIIRSGYYHQFEVPLSVTVKENTYRSAIKQVRCWDGFKSVCEAVQSGEYV